MGRYSLACLFVAGLVAGGPARPNSPAAAPAPERARIHGFVGEIVQIYPAIGRIVARDSLRAGSRKETTFQIERSTRITRAGLAGSAADIHRGDHVTIKYLVAAGGVRRAVTILVTPVAGPGAALRAPAGAPRDRTPD